MSLFIASPHFSNPPTAYPEERNTLYKELDHLIHQIYQEPQETLSLLQHFVEKVGTQDSLYPLAEKVQQVGEGFLRGEAVDHFLFLYPGKPTGSFFAGKASFEGNELSLTSLEEEVRNSEFNENLEVTVCILREALACLEGHKQKPDFSFLNLTDPVAVSFLFEVVDYFGLDAFQEKHLEPFNRKFPDIPLSQTPPTARSLYFSFSDKITAERFREVPSTIKRLFFCVESMAWFDFSHLKELEELVSTSLNNLTAKQIQQLSNSLKKLHLDGVNAKGFDFRHLTGLEELNLSNAENVTAEHIKQFSSTLRRLELRGVNIAGFDFSHLPYTVIVR